jgi:hypothetical protein
MKTTQAIKHKNAILMKCLQTVAKKRRFFPSPLQRLQRHKKLTANSNIASGATQLYNRLEVRLDDNKYVVCKDGKMIIPKPLQGCAVLWYHHYLQHPGHTQLEETIKATMYWKAMRTTVW